MMNLRPTLWLCGGLLLWCSAFVWLYAALSIGCAASLNRGLTATLLTIWLLHLALGIALHGLSWRRAKALPADAVASRRFLASASVWLMAVGWIGTLFLGWPILLLDPCQ